MWCQRVLAEVGEEAKELLLRKLQLKVAEGVVGRPSIDSLVIPKLCLKCRVLNFEILL